MSMGITIFLCVQLLTVTVLRLFKDSSVPVQRPLWIRSSVSVGLRLLLQRSRPISGVGLTVEGTTENRLPYHEKGPRRVPGQS